MPTYYKSIHKSHAYSKLVKGKIQEVDGDQGSYNIGTKFFKPAAKNILKQVSIPNYPRKFEDDEKDDAWECFISLYDKVNYIDFSEDFYDENKGVEEVNRDLTFTLDDDYEFIFGPGVKWLIGDEFDGKDNIFLVSLPKPNPYADEPKWGKPQLNQSVYRSLIEDQGETGYEWFIKLYEKNLSKTTLEFSIDDEKKEFTLDVIFTPINKSMSPENIIYPVDEEIPYPHNRIVFGAPGTGKSFELDSGKDVFDGNFERVTFHPDYSYAQFVGTYKPVPDKDDDTVITYEYVPGPFMRILTESLKDENKEKPYLLIIEEINRANVAAVFGDVFQLLDRDENGVSEYPIQTSQDIRRYLAKEFKCEPDDCSTLYLPNNLYIWATMNSADQGVYVMDTAFKRRWDFEYLSINNSQEEICNHMVILPNKQLINWNSLRIAINDELLRKKVNEDKLIGPFFIPKKYLPDYNFLEKIKYEDKFLEFCIVKKEEDENLSDDEILIEFLKSNNTSMKKEAAEFLKTNESFIKVFKNKVLMYLFEDVLKGKNKFLFSNEVKEDGVISYSNICKTFDSEGIDIFTTDITNKL